MSPENPQDLESHSSDPASRTPEDRPGDAIRGHFQRQRLSVESSSSPFPSPDMIVGYRDAIPGLADRLIDLIESEAKQRRTLEKQRQDAELEDLRARTAAELEDAKIKTAAEVEDMQAERRERRLGQILGFTLAALALASAVIAAGMGQAIMGGVLGGGGIAGLVGAFVFGRLRPNKQGAIPPSGEK